jgi:hypothetical protein
MDKKWHYWRFMHSHTDKCQGSTSEYSREKITEENFELATTCAGEATMAYDMISNLLLSDRAVARRDLHTIKESSRDNTYKMAAATVWVMASHPASIMYSCTVSLGNHSWPLVYNACARCTVHA